jgi:hypothetical protein
MTVFIFETVSTGCVQPNSLPTPVKEIPAPGNTQNPDVRSFCDDNRFPGVPRIVQFGMNPIITRSGSVVFTIFNPGEKIELHPRLAVLIRG